MNPHASSSRITRWAFCLLLGTVVLGCSDPGLSTSTRNDDAGQDERPPGPMRLLFTSIPTRVEAGADFGTQVQVALFSEDGKVDTTWTGTVHISLGVNATVADLDGSLAANAVEGVATFDGLRISHAATGYTLRAATDGFEIAESLAFTVTPAAAATVEFLTQPSSLIAGQVFDPPLEIGLRDAFGNPVANSATPVTLSVQLNGETPPDTLLGTASVTPVQGRALFTDVAPTLAGSGVRLVASIDGVSTTSRRFDVAPDVPVQLAVTQEPNNITAGEIIDPPIAVAVADRYGNRTPSAPRPITLTLRNPPPNANLTGATTATTVDAVAKFPGIGLVIAKTGYVIDISSGELTGTSTKPFNVLPGAVTGLRYLSDPMNPVAGVPWDPPVNVAVIDAYGNIATSGVNPVTIVMRIDPGTDMPLSGTTTVVPVNGIASFVDLSSTEASGSRTNYLYASSPGNPGLPGNPGFAPLKGKPFTISADAPVALSFFAPPVSCAIGSPISNSNSDVTNPVRVQLLDRYGNRVLVPASFSVSLVNPIGGAHLSGTLSVTSVNGLAAFGDLAIDRVGSGYVLEFSTAGQQPIRSNPINIAQLSAADSLVAGPNHTCALKDDLAMYCWGLNASQQITNYVNAYQQQPKPLISTAKGDWTTLTSAASNVTCGQKLDGSLWCRGDNSAGIFGNGTFVSSYALTQELTGSKWLTMSAGGSHACAVKDDQTLWCWGAGAAGQRGDGASGSSVLATSTPAQEQSGSLWRSVSGGLTHTCGIKNDKTLWCWGEGADGQLGNGSNTPSAVPVRESLQATWLSVECGNSHTCGIKTDGSLWCWGLNDKGELGDGTRTSRNVPVRESSSSTWQLVSGGGGHTCGVRTDGTVWCWGAAASGQLGDGRAQTDNLNPVQESSGSNWSTVSTGANHTCGIKSDRSLWCWGLNSSGQLGTANTTSTSVPTREITQHLWGP